MPRFHTSGGRASGGKGYGSNKGRQMPNHTYILGFTGLQSERWEQKVNFECKFGAVFGKCDLALIYPGEAPQKESGRCALATVIVSANSRMSCSSDGHSVERPGLPVVVSDMVFVSAGTGCLR